MKEEGWGIEGHEAVDVKGWGNAAAGRSTIIGRGAA